MEPKQPNQVNSFFFNLDDDFPSLVPSKTVSQVQTPSIEGKIVYDSFTETTSNSSQQCRLNQFPSILSLESPSFIDCDKIQIPLRKNSSPVNQEPISQFKIEVQQTKPQPKEVKSQTYLKQPIFKEEQKIEKKVQDSQKKTYKFCWIDPRPSTVNLKLQKKLVNQLQNQENKNRIKIGSKINTTNSNHVEEKQQDQEYDDTIQQNYTILDFKLANVFHRVVRSPFQLAFRFPYSTRYEYAKAKKYIPPIEKVKQVEWIKLDELKILNLNLDLNIPSRTNQQEQQQVYQCSGYKRKTKVYYGETSDIDRALQFVQIIRKAMIDGVDFILLQQAYQSNIRQLILDLLYDLESTAVAKYFYPENLQQFQYRRATLIISKHPVRFGQLQFQIKEHKDQDPKKFYFPLQAFCQFQVMIQGKMEKVGILNCHLRSNGQKNSLTPPWIMRQKQLDCIYDWGKRQKYDRFFIIGDTNIPTGQKFKTQNLKADTKFFDAYDQGFSKMGGTYLYRNERNEIIDQRMDRVLMNKGIEKNTVVKIQFMDVLLPSCQGKNLDKKKMLARYEDELTYISPSDHEMLDITIYFTKDK